MPAECLNCQHGMYAGGIPPQQCPICGGVYGHPNHPARCLQCNRRIIAIAPECEIYVNQNEPPAEPPV